MTTLTTTPAVSTGSIETFIQQACDLPILSVDQERELLQRYQSTENVEAARELVLKNMRMVLNVAKKFFHLGLPKEDIVQHGAIGLMLAIKKFDLGMEVRFIGYAKYWIRAEILEYVIRNWRIVKIATTKSQRKLFYNYSKLRRLTEGYHANGLTDSQALSIADQLSVPVAEVKAMHQRLSANDEAIESSDAFDQIANVEEDDPLALVEHDEKNAQWQLVLDAINDLNGRERDIIEQRFMAEKPMTLAELAARYEVSIERIRQLEVKALKQLRVSLAA